MDKSKPIPSFNPLDSERNSLATSVFSNGMPPNMNLQVKFRASFNTLIKQKVNFWNFCSSLPKKDPSPYLKFPSTPKRESGKMAKESRSHDLYLLVFLFDKFVA